MHRMADGHIDLNRQFEEAADDENRPLRGLFGTDGGSLTWKDVLDLPRVVVLAEAGSGKSSEFERQVELLVADDAFAFGASVAQVAQIGLEAALAPAQRRRLAAWKDSADAICWLFIDSVDEAKDQGHHFENAARQVADLIAGREERARVIISSRFTDWDVTGDRKIVEKWLSLPTAPPPLAEDLGDQVRATLERSGKPEKPPPPTPIAVLRMTELDTARVRRFAVASKIADVDRLLAAIDHGDLWRFASRPLDLEWIVLFWRQRSRLGSLREMIEESLAARLIDPDLKRRQRDPLDHARCGTALDRIGAGFLFCHKDTLRVPSVGLDLAPSEKTIAIETLLPEWPDGDRMLLLGRSVFDPATLGRARLHNDNEGTLRCYLAARWLHRRLENNCPPDVVADLLFDDRYGYRLVRPDMVETAAWLAGFNETIAETLIDRAPLTLITAGDPGSLPLPTRIKAFTTVLGQLTGIDRDKLFWIDAPLRRFADPALDAHVADWWAQAGADAEARHLVLRLIRLGKLPAGLAIVRDAAFDRQTDDLTQLLACHLLIELGNDDDKARLAAYVLAPDAALPRTYVLEALSGLTPDFISIDAFFAQIDLIGVHDEDGDKSILPLDHEVVQRITTPADLLSLVDHVVARSGELRGRGEENDDSGFREAFAEIATGAATKLLLAAHPDDVPDTITDLVLLLHETSLYGDAQRGLSLLNAQFGTSVGRRRSSYWRGVIRARKHPYTQATEDVHLWSLGLLGWPVTLDDSDIDWLLDDARHRADDKDRLNAFVAAHDIWRGGSRDADVLARIRSAAAGDTKRLAMLDAWLAPQTDSPTLTSQMERLAVLEERNRQHREERDNSWIDLIAKLKAHPISQQDQGAVIALSTCAANRHCALPIPRMLDMFLAALNHPNPTAELQAHYGAYAWSVMGDKALGERMTAAAVAVDPTYPAYRVALIRILAAQGRTADAQSALHQLEALNVGGSLDQTLRELRTLPGMH